MAGWDGTRWIAEGVYHSGPAAAIQAKDLLARRLGVRITQEVFDAAEGVFKSRVVFTEFRGDSPKSEKRHPSEARPLARRNSVETLLGGSNAPLYVAITSLIISILAMIFSIMR